MLKELLLKEAQDLEVSSIELDGIFESVELSEEVKQNFSVVFEQAVKTKAAQLAESHIEALADKADELVESEVSKRSGLVESQLIEAADRLFEHTASEWLSENLVAVEKGIKSNLFDTFFEGVKSLVVEHNVILPENSVDVVAEMEAELQENQEETAKLFRSLVETEQNFNDFKRVIAVEKATSDLAESQREKVKTLIEGVTFNDQFQGKLDAIVAMSKTTRVEAAPIVESANTDNPVINKTNTDDASGLNYVVQEASVVTQPVSQDNSKINQYVAAAKRI